VQDLSGKIVAANQAAADLFRYDLNNLIGSNVQEFYSQEDFELLKVRQKNLLDDYGGHEPYSQEMIRRDGSKAYVMLTANPLSSDGHTDGIQFIGRDITKEVIMQENQSFYLQQITRAHEDERQRISRELHDSTAQSLIAVLLQLEKFCDEEMELSPERLEQLCRVHSQIKDASHEVRHICRNLRPSIIDNLGLLPAVKWLAEHMDEEYGVATEINIIGEERRFLPEVEVTLFRIIQEALRNVAKHAQATQAHVAINFKKDETIVIIADNGAGFELPASRGELARHGKLGIDGMFTRARLAGGTMDIQSKPGFGTTIVVVIPA
jgi:PAS domain S-box-containing protein